MAEASGGRDPMSDLFWFLGVLVFFFCIWFVSGGPEKPEPDPFVALEGQAGGRSRSELLAVRESQASVSSQDAHSDIQDLRAEVEDLEKQAAEARLRGVASPFEGMVNFMITSNGSASLPQAEYLILQAEYGNDVDLDITGWRLQSAVTGNTATIGTAAETPSTGTINAQSAILLPPGGRAVVTTGSSPIGTSFRINTCSGYFEQFQNFSPELSLSCPSPDEEFDASFPENSVTKLDAKETGYDVCRDFVQTIPECTIYRKDLDDVEPRLSQACQSFVRSELSYGGCLRDHRFDSDFYENEWRIYLGARGELWRDKREIVRLLDREGKTVSVFTY